MDKTDTLLMKEIERLSIKGVFNRQMTLWVRADKAIKKGLEYGKNCRQEERERVLKIIDDFISSLTKKHPEYNIFKPDKSRRQIHLSCEYVKLVYELKQEIKRREKS